ncbi:hypothetical protein CKAH01_01835 [Colletotrichum kahawae]|uniref:Uncharacterized protein n=1 Tax=Colletotrichum kahawae TaxID=34407 RepID=A0AAD9Y2L4_COLKA|nr:hypothetical protein CKAH01_01835 [Colletotrichum kahawae]
MSSATTKYATQKRIASSSQPGQAPDSNEKEKKDTPVRRPSTPTLTVRPRARPQSGTRSSPPSIQPQASRARAALQTESAKATRVLHSRVSRISLINQGGICSSCKEPRIGRIL